MELIPWEHKEKIVPFIERQIEIHNKIVDDRLPDEEYLYDENHPRMAAGLSDSFTDDIPTPFYVKKLLKLFEEQINDPTTKTRRATMDKNNRQHIQKLCTFAETHLSLSSPTDDEQDCLQCIVQDLYAHEGLGVSLIESAIKSDNGGLQYHALSVLSEWSPSFSQKLVIQGVIKEIAGRTKDKEDRQLAKQLLKK